MKSLAAILVTVGSVAAVVFALTTYVGQPVEAATRLAANKAQLEHGRYLVHQLGLCIDCHSPRDQKGEFLEDKHLTGSPIPFTPTVPMPWMPAAPRIAGLPDGYTPKDMTHFLMTGERPNGRPGVLPPMPPYRMERRDAEAVTAYLQSMAPAAK
jgi:cytochrome c553